MKTIWKFALDITDRQVIYVPYGAVLLDVQLQDGSPRLWVKVDTDRDEAPVAIRIYGTGHPIEDHRMEYVATFQKSSLVFHVFKEL